MPFVHLHVHTQYSILDGASSIADLFKAAEADGQTALAITDHGNMFGVKDFFKHAKKHPSVKPIIGSEFYVARCGNRFKHEGREEQSAFHLILLAKNMQGYKNLVKLSSYSFIEGKYYHPRIDHDLLEKYHEGLICSSACLAGEVARAITAGDMEKAESLVQWYKGLFGDDYYLEVMRHKTDVPKADTTVYEMQQIVNEKIFELAKKYNVKVIATNDVHFVKKEFGPAHDRLICLVMNEMYDDPERIRYTQQEYLKSQAEMAEIFSDHPEVVENTMEVADKVERYNIDSDPILPHFEIPESFANSDDFLRDLAYKGAMERYPNPLSEEVTERIDFELATIKKMGFPDYFLIVQDFIKEARKMGVWVGPGRGSAAGSVVAYCLGITNIDPLKYDLLFERFLNPDRINMPDIDIDFDDDGRGEVYRYVERKYGKDHISHVITFGTMAAKSAIKDVARIHQVPLEESNRLAKLIPTDKKIEAQVPDPENPNAKIKKEVATSIPNCIEYLPEFHEAYENAQPLVKETIDYAAQLEGSIRQTGVHACATIIGRENLSDFIPLSTATDKKTGEEMLVSQYEGSFIEDVGMLKMDFLGLSTLSILKECVKIIKYCRGIDIDIDKIPTDDKATFQLFSRGDTIAVFQFESEGMRKYLRELKPTCLEDIIAMNALYRPGPMDYIPDFIDRKQGRKPITYDIPIMEQYLKDTYGITVYQEQVMLLSRLLAGFTRGQSDTLRKAMGKKIKSKLDELHPMFLEGGQNNGHNIEILEKIWADWEKFASYAFNKSHATCYAWVAYQTAYMKANYPAEFMAANLSRNLDDIKEITKLMDDCRKNGIAVLGPDINESYTTFTVNKKGAIRFGMAGIKGVGENVINEIIKVRDAGGPFKDIFNFVERVPNTTLNRKVIECMVYAGVFDSLGCITRGQFFVPNAKGEVFIDQLLKYANNFHSLSNSINLFGSMEELNPVRPEYPLVPQVNLFEELKAEKEVVGMYLSSHPLDAYRFEMEQFTNCTLAQLTEVNSQIEPQTEMLAKGKKVENSVLGCKYNVGGIITSAETLYSRSQKPYCKVTIEDFSSQFNFTLFGKEYEMFLPYMKENTPVAITFAVDKLFTKKDSDQQVYKLRIKEVNLLSNLTDRLTGFTLKLPLSSITDVFIKELSRMCKHHKGKARLYIKIMDEESRADVEFFSKKYSISPDKEWLEWLKKNQIDYSVISSK